MSFVEKVHEAQRKFDSQRKVDVKKKMIERYGGSLDEHFTDNHKKHIRKIELEGYDSLYSLYEYSCKKGDLFKIEDIIKCVVDEDERYELRGFLKGCFADMSNFERETDRELKMLVEKREKDKMIKELVRLGIILIIVGFAFYYMFTH